MPGSFASPRRHCPEDIRWLAMRKTWIAPRLLAIGLASVQFCAAQASIPWKIHDLQRPVPPVVDPGQPGQAPSDATVLFDGKDLSKWTGKDGGPATWGVDNGYFEVKPGSGLISTKDAFGDCQLHVEFAEPLPAVGESQQRGNSGVFLMGLYEIQVLDSYQNRTYADGQASAVYGQYPPLVNASRPPGQWQAYDIVFHGPRFSGDGKLVSPARVTILHNGVLVQDNVDLTGPTANGVRPPYKPHAAKLPISLQDHNNRVRYRNMWIRELDSAR
jgi:3-keto-disaccharide hydrolase